MPYGHHGQRFTVLYKDQAPVPDAKPCAGSPLQSLDIAVTARGQLSQLLIDTPSNVGLKLQHVRGDARSWSRRASEPVTSMISTGVVSSTSAGSWWFALPAAS